jgi:hypothetical protein
MGNDGAWPLDLETKPDSDRAMERIRAWYEGEVIDRPPIRFTAHNAEYDLSPDAAGRSWPTLEDRWFEAEYQVDRFEASIRGQEFLAETFPVFWPNLGPGVYAALFGCRLTYGEVTAWSEPLVRDWSEAADLRLDRGCRHFRALEEMTRLGLDRCRGRYLVGYTDFHPGLDCVADFLGFERLCTAIIEAPDRVKALTEAAGAPFHDVFDHFDRMVKVRRQPSVTWMAIPSFGKMHIPSCDVATALSPRHFEEFGLPAVLREVMGMTHNVFHVDGKGVARHLDRILAIQEVGAIQWVQGMGLDKPMVQWIPLLDRIRAARKSVVIDLEVAELEEFIGATHPEGLFLCIGADPQAQRDIIRRIERW